MPRESVIPDDRMRQDVASDGTTSNPHLHRMPTVEVGWARDTASVQIGLETPDERSDHGPDGQHHLVDYLYASRLEGIGANLAAALAERGYTLGVKASTPVFDYEALGRIVLDAVTGADGEGHPGSYGYTGWYTHLTRAGCNRLITIIRKARDSAFGKDE